MKIIFVTNRKFASFCAIVAALVGGTFSATAAVATWANTGTDWNTATNWSPSGIPANNSTDTFNSSSYTAQPNVTATGGKGNSMDIKGAGTLSMTGAGTITIASAGGITMESTAGPATLVNMTLSVSQTYLNSSPNLLSLNAVNVGTTTLSLDGIGNITAAGAVTGSSGALTLKSTYTGTATLQGVNTYAGATTVSGGKLLVNGSLAAGSAVAVNANATLGGSGTINGAATVNASGTLAPGPSGTITTLTFGSTLSLAGTNTMQVNRSGFAADKIVLSSGAVTLGGVLNVVNLGSSLQNGDSFTLISGTIASGSFYSSIVPSTPGAGLQWDMSHLTNGGDGTLRVMPGAYVPPIASNDTYTLQRNGSFTTNAPGVLFNDSDPESLPLTAVSNTLPANGSLTFSTNGGFTYTPNAGFSGTDSFTYVATDGIGFSSNATVTLNVVAGDQAPVASNDSYTVNRNGVLATIAPGVLANDSDPDNDTITATNFTQPSHGTLTAASDGSFTYTPTNHYVGIDTFTYQAFDGQLTSPVATVTITVVDHAPVAVNDSFGVTNNNGLSVAAPGVLANDTDADSDTLTAAVVASPAHGSLTLNGDGSFTYTPNGTYFGSDNFTYQASDGVSNSTTATVTLTNVPGTYTWNGGANASWNTTANWSANDIPIGKVVRYDSTSASNLTETLDRVWSIGGITVANVASPITLLNDGNTLTNTGGIDMSGAGADLTILENYVGGGAASIAAGRTLTLSNIVGGNLNGSSGPGTLRLIGTASPGQIVDTTGSLTMIVDGGFISSNPPVRLDAESGGTVTLIVTNNGTVQITGNGVKLHVGFVTNSGVAGTNIVKMESGLIAIAFSSTSGPSGLYVPNGSNSVGIFNLDGGTVALTNKFSTDVPSAGETALQIPFSPAGMGTVNLNGGTLIVPTITGTNLTTGSGTLNFNGTVVTANRPNSNWITNIQNAFVLAGGAIFDTGGNAVTIAEVLQAGSLNGGLTKQGGAGTLTLKGVNTYTGPTLINAGTLGLSGNGSIGASALINLAASCGLDASGRSDQTFTLGSGQVFVGSGTVTGNLTGNSGSTLVPAGSNTIGILTVSGIVTLSGTTVMDVNKTANTSDEITGATSVVYGGTLNVNNLSGTLAAGDSFQLFNAGSYSGAFAGISPATPGAGLSWNTSSLTNGVLSVQTAVATQPSITGVSQSAGNIMISGKNNTGPGGTYHIRTSTNVTLSVTNWTTLTNGMFDGSGNFSFTNAIGTNQQQFFILLVP